MSQTQQIAAAESTSTPGWDAIADHPPSAKLVAKVLEYNDALTQSQIADRSKLPGRTVRYALGRLEDVDVVESRPSFRDARKRVYSLAIEDDPGPA